MSNQLQDVAYSLVENVSQNYEPLVNQTTAIHLLKTAVWLAKTS